MSDTDRKVQLIKNPERNKPAVHKPYVPQYQVHGKEPQEYQGGAVVPGHQMARPTPLPNDNPRAKRVPIRQPYAEAAPSPIGRGRGPIPNVGNNMEQTWSSVDGELIDDLTEASDIDQNQQMIDNNEYVSGAALGFQNGITAADISPNYQVFGPQAIEQEVEATHYPADPNDLLPVLTALDNDAYLLIVGGVPVCSGPKDEIEDQAQALVFGEHELSDGNPVPVDDIVILKRVKVRVGLFLE